MTNTTVTKKDLMTLFRGYKKMDSHFQKKLIEMGFQVVPCKKHYKLYFNDQLFILSSTSSDHRAGRNMVSLIAKTL